MMLPFDGNFDKSQAYLVSGKDLIAWGAGYRADRVIPGRGMEVAGTPQGRIFSAIASGGESGRCTLGEIEPDPANDGKMRLSPGFITGGGVTINLELINLEPEDGDHFYIEVSWSGVAEDGIMIPGGTMTNAVVNVGAAVPDDDDFTVESPAGKFYIPLGIWRNEQLENASCGNVGVSMCPNEARYWRA